MTEENNLQVKSKLNKKLIIAAIAVIAVVLTALLLIFVPKSASAKKVEEQLNLGAKYLSELQYEQAEAAYLAAIEIDPKNVDAYLGLADVYIAQGEYDKAIAVLELAATGFGDSLPEELQEKLELIRKLRNEAEVTPSPTPEPTATSTPTPTPSPTPVVYREGIFEWIYNEEGTITIVGVLDDTVTEVIFPETIKGTAVTKIGDYVTSGFRKLERVVFPDSITEIGYTSFATCESLESVKLSKNLVSIGTFSFTHCDFLTSIDLPEGLREIGEDSFYGCPLYTVNIPASVEKMGEGVFRSCEELTAITVDRNNKNFCSVDGVLFDIDRKTLYCYPAGKVQEEYDIPYGVERIGRGAFDNCQLRNVTIPDTVTSIGAQAFMNCHKMLDTLIIPASVTDIGNEPGIQIKNIMVSEDNPNYANIGRFVYAKEDMRLLTISVGDGDPVCRVPEGIKIIEYGSLRAFIEAEEIILPDGVEEIRESEFIFFELLKRIHIPSSVKVIPEEAFLLCENLIIVTPAGSYAEQVAKENNLKVEHP